MYIGSGRKWRLRSCPAYGIRSVISHLIVGAPFKRSAHMAPKHALVTRPVMWLCHQSVCSVDSTHALCHPRLVHFVGRGSSQSNGNYAPQLVDIPFSVHASCMPAWTQSGTPGSPDVGMRDARRGMMCLGREGQGTTPSKAFAALRGVLRRHPTAVYPTRPPRADCYRPLCSWLNLVSWMKGEHPCHLGVRGVFGPSTNGVL